MNVKELRDLLKKQDQNCEVVINGIVIEGVTVLQGKFQEGHFNWHFSPNPKGRAKAVTLTRATERSDGVVDQTHIF